MIRQLLRAFIFLLPCVFLSRSFAAPDGAAIYNKVCSLCHATGLAGAPKFRSNADWAKHQKPLVDLYKNAIHGYGAMPPKGGNMTLSDDEVRAAVDYMLKEAKLPWAPKA